LPERTIETNRSRVAARLEREEWVVRHGSNHDVYKHPSKPGRIVVARHRTLSIGVAQSDREDRRLGQLRKGDRDNGAICSTARR
jgi:hypothetical protein